MSFANYRTKDASGAAAINYSRVVNMLITNPIKEEFVFRGCIFYVLYRRGGRLIPSILVCNVLFGLFHMINFFGTAFSPFYVALQVHRSLIVTTSARPTPYRFFLECRSASFSACVSQSHTLCGRAYFSTSPTTCSPAFFLQTKRWSRCLLPSYLL